MVNWGGESQGDASVWLLQRLTCLILHTDSQERRLHAQCVGTRVSIWRIGTAGQEMEVVVNILAFDFKYLFRLLNVVSTVDAYVLMLMYYTENKQTNTIFHIIHHLMQHFPRIAIIVLLTLHC